MALLITTFYAASVSRSPCKMCTSRSVLQLLLLSCFSRVQLFATPWTAAHQAPPSMGFSRQEYWSGVSSPSLTSFLFIIIINVVFLEHLPYARHCFRAPQVALVVKKPPANVGDLKDVDLIPWRKKWQPTPVFLPWESYEQRGLVGNGA